MIIDSHCHLEYEPMTSDLKKVIERAHINNVKYLLISGHTNECQIDGGLSGYKDSDYGHFAYHFYGLDENHLSELVDCEVRLNRLYEIDSILD